MGETLIRVGPADPGRRMSLDEFDRARGVEGYGYELGKGVAQVVDVPHMERSRRSTCGSE
jgi:hypothetical protein